MINTTTVSICPAFPARILAWSFDLQSREMLMRSGNGKSACSGWRAWAAHEPQVQQTSPSPLKAKQVVHLFNEWSPYTSTLLTQTGSLQKYHGKTASAIPPLRPSVNRGRDGVRIFNFHRYANRGSEVS